MNSQCMTSACRVWCTAKVPGLACALLICSANCSIFIEYNFVLNAYFKFFILHLWQEQREKIIYFIEKACTPAENSRNYLALLSRLVADVRRTHFKSNGFGRKSPFFPPFNFRLQTVMSIFILWLFFVYSLIAGPPPTSLPFRCIRILVRFFVK